jgi:hypothetical protein
VPKSKLVIPVGIVQGDRGNERHAVGTDWLRGGEERAVWNVCMVVFSFYLVISIKS